jgi:hypothetical protein
MIQVYPTKWQENTDKGIVVGLENSGDMERMNTET